MESLKLCGIIDLLDCQIKGFLFLTKIIRSLPFENNVNLTFSN